jgi:hypothetical protein
MISDLGGGRQLARHLSTGCTGRINNPSRPHGSFHSPQQFLGGIDPIQEQFQLKRKHHPRMEDHTHQKLDPPEQSGRVRHEFNHDETDQRASYDQKHAVQHECHHKSDITRVSEFIHTAAGHLPDDCKGFSHEEWPGNPGFRGQYSRGFAPNGSVEQAWKLSGPILRCSLFVCA